jgi:hypothetical protein
VLAFRGPTDSAAVEGIVQAPARDAQLRRVAKAIAKAAEARQPLRDALAIFERLPAGLLSPKTIESHLSSAYRKLGVRSRVELAQVLSAHQA